MEREEVEVLMLEAQARILEHEASKLEYDARYSGKNLKLWLMEEALWLRKEQRDKLGK
jgi:hypothetical protein